MTDDQAKKIAKAPSKKNPKGSSAKSSKPKKRKTKKVYSFGLFSFMLVITVLLAVSILTPAYSLLLSKLPPSAYKFIFSGLYKNIEIIKEKTLLDEPFKAALEENLPVLGFDSGICFSFYSTETAENLDYIDSDRIKAASHGHKIAEIIVIGEADGYEYQLESTYVKTTQDEEFRDITLICQKFGNKYASLPEKMKDLYVRPLEPFSPDKMVWSSTKNLLIRENLP